MSGPGAEGSGGEIVAGGYACDVDKWVIAPRYLFIDVHVYEYIYA